MSTITFTRSAWEAFKRTVMTDACISAAESTTEPSSASALQARVASALCELEADEVVLELPTNSAVPALVGGLVSSSPPVVTRPATRDAATQLTTARGYYLSSHILNEVRLRRSVRSLSRQVGHAHAQLLTAYNTIWTLLAYVVTGAAHVSVPDSDWYADISPIQRSGTPVPSAAATRIDSVMAILDPTITRALCAVQHFWREHFPRTADEDSAEAPTPHRFVRHTLTGWATRSPCAWDSSATDRDPHSPKGGAFLCRRCRKDQRGEYDYDVTSRRLAGVATKPPVPPPLPPSGTRTVSRGATARARQGAASLTTRSTHSDEAAASLSSDSFGLFGAGVSVTSNPPSRHLTSRTSRVPPAAAKLSTPPTNERAITKGTSVLPLL